MQLDTPISLGSVDEYGVFTWPKGTELTNDGINAFIQYNEGHYIAKYKELRDLYRTAHEILLGAHSKVQPDNRIAVALPFYIVSNFDGFFQGVPPTISLKNAGVNAKLQDWLTNSSFTDNLAEAGHLATILGRSYLLAFQNENKETKVASIAPDRGFMIYDHSIEHTRLAFVSYYYDAYNNLHGYVYQKGTTTSLNPKESNTEFIKNPTNRSHEVEMDIEPVETILAEVPAVEIVNNAERTSILAPGTSLFNAIDKAISQKANQVEYFDDAYLYVLGLKLPTTTNEDGEEQVSTDIRTNRMFYSPDADATKAKIGFMAKPDADGIQEHLIDRLTNLAYQTCMVANLNDEAFSGNASGVAIKYKLLPMQNLAATKERKMTLALRDFFKMIFNCTEVVGPAGSETVADLTFKFIRNEPVDIASEATSAKNLIGTTSKETALSTLSFVPDPQAEMKKIAKENADSIKQSIQISDQNSQQGAGDSSEDPEGNNTKKDEESNDEDERG